MRGVPAIVVREEGLVVDFPFGLACWCAAVMPDGTWVPYPDGGLFPRGSLVVDRVRELEGEW